ncbi:MAG: aspartate aminotransferase family protein [Candidatus Binataceae bacterium]
MSEVRGLFRPHLAPTSKHPIGLEIDRAEGSWLIARGGRRYLDFIAGIGVSALGHVNPEVLAAIEAQLRRHLHVMVYGEYSIESQERYAALIARMLPPALASVYFTNSGAEAIEGALKVARKHTGRTAFAAFDGAYHGDTMGALALAGNPAFREPFEPLPGPVLRLPYGNAAALGAIDDSIAAVVVEPVQAEGGVRIPPPGFLQALRERCDHMRALLIFDEVLTGLGRTGRLFAMEHSEVVPDIIVLAKALGGGLPLGAFCGRDEVIGVLSHDPPLGHITTFGGNPLSCAAGMAVFNVIVRDRLPARAVEAGASIMRKLRGLNAPEIAAVRGIGLLIGMEFHDAKTAHRFVAETLARGVVINWTLNAEAVVRIAPPLTISAGEIDFAMNAIEGALNAVRR